MLCPYRYIGCGMGDGQVGSIVALGCEIEMEINLYPDPLIVVFNPYHPPVIA
jgi:hypothetical protein